ncbi:hypothetical protein DFH09DRAFT_1078690 [Mycena vulgaris]|nr:hypothetical protein DFH09DRAFT_1078690 [Mycena vulgaris]
MNPREWICRKSASVVRYRKAYGISEAKTQWEKGQSVVLRLSIIWRSGVRRTSGTLHPACDPPNSRARASFRAGPFFPVLVGTIWVPNVEDESIPRADQHDEAMPWKALLLDVRLFPWIGYSFDQKDQSTPRPPAPQKFEAQFLHQLSCAGKSRGRTQMAVITVAEATIIIARIISLRFSTSNIHDTLQSVAAKISTGVVFSDPTVAAAIMHLLADPELIFRSPPHRY